MLYFVDLARQESSQRVGGLGHNSTQFYINHKSCPLIFIATYSGSIEDITIGIL